MVNNKRFYRLVSILLIAVMLLQVTGCSMVTGKGKSEEVVIEAMEPAEVYKYSFDAIGGEDVMPIIAFYGPATSAYSYNGNTLPDYYSEEFFELIAGTGINMIGYNGTDYKSYPTHVVKMLELAEENGMGLLVNDSRILTGDLTIEQIDTYINDYSNYPAYCGNYIKDEPYHTEYRNTADKGVFVEDFASIFTKMTELGHFGYGNLFPIGLGPDEAYEQYVSDYLKLCNPVYLGYDLYPFNKEEGLQNSENYFKNIFVMRKAAEEAGLPYYAFAQCGSQWNDNQLHFDTEGYYPNRGQFFWNVGTLLACGAKGIQYFMLIQPYWFAYSLTEPFDFQRNGLIGAWGNKTRWYYYAQDMNAQIAAVDEVLMNAANVGVIATTEDVKTHMGDAGEYLMGGTSWRELKGASGEALIGCFNYQGKTALYVVNYDMEYAQKINLDFVKNCNVTVIQDAKESNISGNNLELTLSAGNSALVVFE